MLPTLSIAVRVEFIARHVPSQAGNETSVDVETLFVSFTFINSHKWWGKYPTLPITHSSLCDRVARENKMDVTVFERNRGAGGRGGR